ncbi:DUF1385 domain-containing protein [Candidatus Woesearchaeota archaeon]|nr:DUF1385 domain-containing protein [Candidatus Woesearchaeota archaeon]
MKVRIGGQAVVEGVMMRSDNFISTAVRTEKGEVKKRTRRFNSLTEKHRFLGLPFVRGVFMLFELMGIGLKEISWSAEQAGEDEPLTKKEMFFTFALSLLLVLSIFKLLPWFLANFFTGSSSLVGVNVVDGILKLLIFIIYLFLISLLPDVKRLYEYHGAEHKVVACYESGLKLTPSNANKFSRLHPRCGTTFVFVVFLIGILVYLLIPLNTGFWGNYFIRIMLLPLIAGISYELLRLEGKYYCKSRIVRILMWPGIQFQRLTTRNPSLKQLSVAITSLNECIKSENSLKSKKSLKKKS